MKKLLVVLGCACIVFAACGGPRDEKQAFIDATTEATCHIFQAENIFDPALEDEAKEIYKKYGFDADDDAAMEALTKKYEEDEEVQSAIMAGLEECGGDLFSGLEEAFEDLGGELEEGEMDIDLEAEVEGEADTEEEAAPSEEESVPAE